MPDKVNKFGDMLGKCAMCGEQCGETVTRCDDCSKSPKVKIGQIWELNPKTDIDKMDYGSYMIILSIDSEFFKVALFGWYENSTKHHTAGWCGAGIHDFTEDEIKRNSEKARELECVVRPKDADSTARTFER